MRVAETPCVARDERLALVVEQHDGEHLVVDQAAQQLPNALEQRAKIENRRQLNGNLVQNLKRARLARYARVEPRVLNGLRYARRRKREQVQMLGLEVAGLLALNVHHADEPVLGDQRKRQFRPHVGVGWDVVLRLGHVVQQHGLASKRHLAHDALAHGHAHALSLRRVADLETHAQLVGAFVEQQDGKDAVVDDRANELRGAIEQRLQVERGVESVGELEQISRVNRLNARVYRVEMRDLGGAVVALELGRLGARDWELSGHAVEGKDSKGGEQGTRERGNK